MAEVYYFIKSTEELREAVGTVSLNFTFENIHSEIEEAAIRYLRNDLGIGKTFFDSLLTDYNATPDAYNQFDATKKRLIRFLRKVTGNFALYHWLDTGSFTVGSAGAANEKSDKTEKVAKWQIEKGKAKHLRSAFEAFEQLLEFLEENKNTFTAWRDSDAKTLYTGGFINTITEFAQYYPMVQSRRTLRAIRPAQTHIEDFIISEVISSGLYAEIKAQIKNGSTITNANKALLVFIKPACAWLTMQKAFSQLRFVIDEKGLQVLSTASNSDNYDESRSVNGGELSSLITEASNQAAFYIKKLSDYLYDNHATYPLYEEATQYTNRADNQITLNEQTKKSFRT